MIVNGFNRAHMQVSSSRVVRRKIVNLTTLLQIVMVLTSNTLFTHFFATAHPTLFVPSYGFDSYVLMHLLIMHAGESRLE